MFKIVTLNAPQKVVFHIFQNRHRIFFALILMPMLWMTNSQAAAVSRNKNSSSDTAVQALRNPRLTSATREFGPTVIDLAQLPFSSPVLDTGRKPWSSWWFPKIDRDFTKPRDPFRVGILDKFDVYARSLGIRKSALATELTKDKNFATWEGLCDAWAIASIMHPEPIRATKVSLKRGAASDSHEVNFSVFDLKGLLLKLYEAVDESQFNYYGEKFYGNANGWVYPDLYPAEFHRLIEVYIGERRQPLIMDHDAGPEVWTVPVYKANFKVERDPAVSNQVKVKMWLFTAAPAESNQKEFVGTINLIREYTYVLSGTTDFTGRYLTIQKGDWTDGSIMSHPDYMFTPKSDKIQRKSYNENIDIQLVDELLKRAI